MGIGYESGFLNLNIWSFTGWICFCLAFETLRLLFLFSLPSAPPFSPGSSLPGRDWPLQPPEPTETRRFTS